MSTRLLDELTRQAKGRRIFDEMIEETVKVARFEGYTWQEIGEALGVSYQAVIQKYKKKVEVSG